MYNDFSMQAGLVSVMMPAYNAERYIAQAIESVLSQTISNWELVIVDDGSKDQTAAIAAGYTDSRIHLIHQTNAGEASARNTALANMQGEFVAFLDADDAYLAQHLEVTLGYLQKSPDQDGVYTDGYHIDQEGTRLKSLTSRRRGPFEGWVFEQAVRASDVFGPPTSVVIRRQLILQHQLDFDTRIIIGPDWDFFIRFSEYGNFGYEGDATCLYRVHLHNITFQTNQEKRLLSLALCREKAIKLSSFPCCSAETRTYVFYDLLINLLSNYPQRQAEITSWPEFKVLPTDQQGRLYRLMASQAIRQKGDGTLINTWLSRSHELNPADKIAIMLSAVYRLSPYICNLLLHTRSLTQSRSADSSPFADLQLQNDAHRNIS